MKETGDGISVSILGKQFMVACPEEEQDSLMAAAKYLDQQMRNIHKSGKVLGAERCAIMAALNIANELLQCRGQAGLPAEMDEQIRSMQLKISAVLGDSAQLPL
jgi:cell division protein ZapA